MYINLVKNKRLILSLVIVLAAILFSSPTVPSAHAQFTGLVCITDTTTATGCAPSPLSLGPFSVGQNFTVGVFVQGSEAMAGFEIYVKSDPAIVNPVSAALGSLIAHPALSDMCIDNVSFTVNQCSPGGVNGPGVVQVGATEITGTNECGGVSPCSGMAFTITYNVVGQAMQTSLFYPTAASCSSTSVFSQPNTCVVIVNAVRTILPESIQGATVAQTKFTGLVCVTFPSTATSCPATPSSIGPLSVGSSFTVGIFAQGSDAMGGFDIFVASDPAFVTPVSAALGTLIVTPSLTSICVNGSAQTGSCTVGSANSAGVVEVTTIESSGSNECGGISPCSGMAFTITYTVVAATPSTSLSYPTAAGCATSSVSSPANTCVLVDDATGTTLPENIQGATINIALPPAIVCIVIPPTATSCPSGVPNYPETFGSIFTVGVWLQGSPPLGGFDIYVSADPNYLNPINAALGPGITNPSLTNICIDGSAQTGSCGVANGPGIVEVSTIEGSGGNDPGTGLLFTITYRVVGVTPSTTIGGFLINPDCSTSSISSPPNVCVLIADNIGNTLPENTQGANIVQTHPTDPTRMSVSCAPDPVVVGHVATCTVIVNDVAPSGRVPPIGKVTFTTDQFGNFNPNMCILSPINATASSCQILYEPLHVGTRVVNVGGIYLGDPIEIGTTGSISLSVLPDQTSISSIPINSQTGLPVNGTVLLGIPVFDRAFLFGGFGFNGGLGVTGTVTYTLYPPNPLNIGCKAGTGTIISTYPVGPGDQVPDSAPVTPSSTGTWSFNAFYHNDTSDNLPSAIGVTSQCEPFTVGLPPQLTAPTLHWTHHLSLSKSSNTQSWTATAANPFTTSVRVLVRIVGISTTNPSLTFDVTCGVTCVSTASGGVNFTPGLAPVTVAAGASSFSFGFNQPISGIFVNQKVAFTTTLYWTTGTVYNSGNSKSGAFAVVS